MSFPQPPASEVAFGADSGGRRGGQGLSFPQPPASEVAFGADSGDRRGGQGCGEEDRTVKGVLAANPQTKHLRVQISGNFPLDLGIHPLVMKHLK